MQKIDLWRLLAGTIAGTGVAFGAAGQSELEAGIESSLAGGPAADEDEETPETPTSFFQGWDGNVSAGINGASGNSEFFTLTTQLDGARSTEENDTSFLLRYVRGQGETPGQGSGELQNRGEFRARNDFLFPDSKWFAFTEGVFEYDEFQDWATRLQLFAGPGYVWVDTEKTTFKTRAGAGAVREFLGSDNAWRAEGILSADLRQQLTERQKLTAVLDVFPDLGDSRLWRARFRGQWELVVDPEVNMTLTIGVEDRYDMDPGPDPINGGTLSRNDVEYFALLGWAF